jgi:outer membrane protein TolC
MPQPKGSQERGRLPWRLGGCLAGVAAGLVAAAPSASAQTLTEAFAYTYNNNPSLLAERARLRATDEQVPQALAGWRPTVQFRGQGGYTRGALENSNPALPVPSTTTYSSFTSKQLDLNVTQPVYNGGQTEAQTRQAINNVESERANELAVETQVFQAVAQAYLDVVRDQTLVEVARNNEQVLKKQLEATRDRFRVGEVTRTDVAQAESSLAQATAQRINAEGQLEVSRASYTRQVSASFSELAARDNVDVVRSRLLPQISIIGDVNRNFSPSLTLQNARQDTASVTAQLTMPLYEGGAVYSQTRAAQQTVGQQRSVVDDRRRQAVQNAAQAWETLQAARAAIASFGAAVRAAQIALEGTQQEALVGSRTVLDVLIAEQQLFTTQSQLVQAEHDAALQEFNLAAATGRLIAPEMKLPVQLYDMERHYKQVKDKWFGFGGGLKE